MRQITALIAGLAPETAIPVVTIHVEEPTFF